MEEIKKYVGGASHDYYHLIRVYNNTVNICKNIAMDQEDKFIVQASALLHDIGRNNPKDFQKSDNHEKVSSILARTILKEHKVPDNIIAQVEKCILGHRAIKAEKTSNILIQIIRDADKLDALGAIAVARTFSYDSSRPIYLPDDAPKDVYDGISNSSLNHIIEKVLNLTPDKFYTTTAQSIAKDRLEFAKEFVAEFLSEWDGEK